MKRNIAPWLGFTRCSRSGLGFLATLLISGSLGCLCQAAGFVSPEGTWDFVSSGAGQRGITYLTFTRTNDYSGDFSGFSLVSGRPNSIIRSGGRNPGGDIGRTFDTTSLTSSNSFVYGFSPVSGMWEFDYKGRVIGSFSEILDATQYSTNYYAFSSTETITNHSTSDTTNILVVFLDGQATADTNYIWSTNYTEYYVFDNPNYATTPSAGKETNSVSFVGRVVPGRRFNIIADSSYGKVVFRGLPASANLSDLEGAWYGVKRQQQQRLVEFFDLQSFTGGNPFVNDFPGITNYPNIYFTTDGVGASYDFVGISVLSRWNRIGFVILESPETNTVMRATVGHFVHNRLTKGVTQGVIEPNIGIRFTAIKQ